LAVVMCTLSGSKYSHIVVQSSLPSSSRFFSSSQTETPYSLNTNSPSPSPCSRKPPFCFLFL
jgi:hypothetical protein